MNVDATLSAACRAQLRLVQSMRSANVRAESIVFNRDALSAYARNRPPLWKPVRQMPREMQRWGVPPTTVSFCELRTLRRHSALSACERRAARTAWSLSGGGRRALARAAHQGCQAVWLVCSVQYECQRASSCALLATRARLGHEPHSVCEFAYTFLGWKARV